MKRIIVSALLMVTAICVVLAEGKKIDFTAITGGSLSTFDFEESGNDKGYTTGGLDKFTLEYSDGSAGAKIQMKAYLPDYALTMDEYYGWMSFGSVKFTAGEFDSRYSNRVKNEESAWGVWEKFKYGALKNGSQVKESENVALWGRGDMVAEIKFGNVSFAVGTGTNSVDDTFSVAESLAARGAFAIGETAKVSATFSRYAEDFATAGLFCEVLSIENLNLVVGYSGAFDLEESDNTVHAGELRARYAFGKYALTSHNNVSIGTDTMTVYNMANVAMKVDDRITALLYANNINVSGSAAEDAGADGNRLTVRPGVTLTAQKGVTLDAGLEFCVADVGGTKTNAMSVPVVVRVKL